jgi:membrane protease subunit HflK
VRQGRSAVRLARGNRARGEADRFVRIYGEYRKAPDVTRRRIYLEAVADVLKKARQKVVVDESQKGITPLLIMEGAKLPGAATAKLEESP